MYRRPTRPAPDNYFLDLALQEHEEKKKRAREVFESYLQRYETSRPFQQALAVLREEIDLATDLAAIEKRSKNNKDLVENIKVANRVAETLKRILGRLEPKEIKKILDKKKDDVILKSNG